MPKKINPPLHIVQRGIDELGGGRHSIVSEVRTLLNGIQGHWAAGRGIALVQGNVSGREEPTTVQW